MPPARRLVETRLPDINDAELKNLISELHFATQVEPNPRYTLWDFLLQCHYPLGYGQWFPIGKEKIIPGGILSRRVGKFEGTPIYTMCDEIARMQNSSAELALNMSLYVFLDRFMPNFEKQHRKKPHDPRRWI
jgi:hypothetical protein